MMKRTGTTTSRPSHPNPIREGILPLVTNGSHNTSNNRNNNANNNNNRRRSTGKKVIVRVTCGMLLLCSVTLYILGTRHVLLHQSASISSLSGGIIYDIVYSTNAHNSANANANGNDHRRVLFQPIIVHSSPDDQNNERKNPTTGRRQQQQQQQRPIVSSQKPRTVGHYYTLTDSMSFVGTERLDPNRTPLYDNTHARIVREEFMTKAESKHQTHLLDSKDYAYGMADTMEDMGEHCKAQYDWQEKSFPTCNHLMEVDMTNLNLIPMFHDNHYNNKHDLPLASSSLHSYSKIIAHGYWRDVWRIQNLLRNHGNHEETVVLKTMRYEHEYVPRNYDRHRRDAVAMERLTSSNFVMGIYAACGNSALFEYADGGSLDDSIWYNKHQSSSDKAKPWSPQEKLVVAYQAVSGIADLHNFAKEGVPSIAHTDITTQQFVYVEEAGLYKLNDFNRARFLAKNEKTNEICTYEVGNNPGNVRIVLVFVIKMQALFLFPLCLCVLQH